MLKSGVFGNKYDKKVFFSKTSAKCFLKSNNLYEMLFEKEVTFTKCYSKKNELLLNVSYKRFFSGKHSQKVKKEKGIKWLNTQQKHRLSKLEEE